ncbi:hypothetical protein FGO68_gene118 [Halteria grandinella]|uniref:Uncharacterized protein n=1 Tax=Halteria grandinella TaxID=5974 RepID=A0A8J8T032_HALGN|nr:hypothetical protein FGO68_gene118 [Halteria grandinella]
MDALISSYMRQQIFCDICHNQFPVYITQDYSRLVCQRCHFGQRNGFTFLRANLFVYQIRDLVRIQKEHWEELFEKVEQYSLWATAKVQKYAVFSQFVKRFKDIQMRLEKLCEMREQLLYSPECVRIQVEKLAENFQVRELLGSQELIDKMEKDLQKYIDLTRLNDIKFFELYETEIIEIDQALIFKDVANSDFILRFYLQALLNLAFKETEADRQKELAFIQNDQSEKILALQLVKDYVEEKMPKVQGLSIIYEKIEKAYQILGEQQNNKKQKNCNCDQVRRIYSLRIKEGNLGLHSKRRQS